MLPLWRDRLLLSLAPAGVSWVRLGRERSRILAKRTVEVDPNFATEPWRGPVAALRSEAEGWRNERIAVTVVLSNHFARYLMVPASPGLRGTDEAQALARFHFARVHGERSRDWEVRLASTRAGLPQIACAIDGALMAAVRACFPASSAPRLASVQPYLMSAFNRWRARFPDAGAWFLLLEPDRACVALIAGERWLSVQNLRGEYGHPDALSDLVERERWRINRDEMPETVLVHGPRATAAPLSGPPWRELISGAFWPAGVTLPADSHYCAALTAS